RVRALVAVADPLVVLGRRQRDRGGAVAEREDRHLLALEQLLDEKRLPERLRGAQRSVELGLRTADPDALAGRQAVRLYDARRPGDRERARRRHARVLEDVLGEALRALDPGGG